MRDVFDTLRLAATLAVLNYLRAKILLILAGTILRVKLAQICQPQRVKNVAHTRDRVPSRTNPPTASAEIFFRRRVNPIFPCCNYCSSNKVVDGDLKRIGFIHSCIERVNIIFVDLL